MEKEKRRRILSSHGKSNKCRKNRCFPGGNADVRMRTEQGVLYSIERPGTAQKSRPMPSTGVYTGENMDYINIVTGVKETDLL